MKSVWSSLINLLIVVPVTLFGGWIFSKMWSWFIVPKFGVSSLSVVEAVGVLLTVNFLFIPLQLQLAPNDPKVSSEMHQLTKTLLTGAVLYPLTLLGAYVWHLFL